MPTVIIHIMNEDPVMGEMEDLPKPADSMIYVRNPRRRDGKEVPYLLVGVKEAFWPLTRVTFIEVVPTEEEEIISFVRE
jgi:hypothetical protein